MERHGIVFSLALILGATAWGYNISDVTISPAAPTTQSPVTVTVTGEAPSTNYHLDHADKQQIGNIIFLNLYWSSTDNGGMVMVPYTHDESLGTLAAGRYTVYVRGYDNGLVRANDSVSFSVTRAATSGSVWPGFFLFFWSSWPGMGTSASGTQSQIITINNGQISFEFSFTNQADPD